MTTKHPQTAFANAAASMVADGCALAVA